MYVKMWNRSVSNLSWNGKNQDIRREEYRVLNNFSQVNKCISLQNCFLSRVNRSLGQQYTAARRFETNFFTLKANGNFSLSHDRKYLSVDVYREYLPQTGTQLWDFADMNARHGERRLCSYSSDGSINYRYEINGKYLNSLLSACLCGTLDRNNFYLSVSRHNFVKSQSPK